MTDEDNHGPPSIIVAALMRSGTLSMARAFEVLGMRAHHGLTLAEGGIVASDPTYAALERASDAKWPASSSSPGAPGAPTQPQPLTRADWDAVFGNYDVITDLGSYFAEELVSAYPGAKVVVVERNFDNWYASYDGQIISPLMSPAALTILPALTRITGLRSPVTMQRILRGFFGDATTAQQMRDRARDVHARYYERIRELVPAERRLEFSHSMGWEPLCAFLGKPVPDGPFPRVNEAAEHTARQMDSMKDLGWVLWGVMKPYVLGASAIVVVIAAVVALKLR
ncbi:hypothetical protein BX600DRAFT_467917 [Xylariales sp. PMI_506]|nr:hypothetical protein BX600DRAFT_467917 [Xylariales sp. PMI_506]